MGCIIPDCCRKCNHFDAPSTKPKPAPKPATGGLMKGRLNEDGSYSEEIEPPRCQDPSGRDTNGNRLVTRGALDMDRALCPTLYPYALSATLRPRTLSLRFVGITSAANFFDKEWRQSAGTKHKGTKCGDKEMRQSVLLHPSHWPITPGSSPDRTSFWQRPIFSDHLWQRAHCCLRRTWMAL
jgi:hypothetical protein